MRRQFRGRFFGSHYGEFDRREDQAAVTQVRTLDPNISLYDIADEHFDHRRFGTVRVTCWPSPEGVDTGRRWGKYQSANAVIMPFRSKAQLSTDLVRLHTYELELFLCSNQPESSGALLFSERCPLGRSGEPCDVHSDLSLVDLPAPSSKVGPSTRFSESDSTPPKLWKLRSESGCVCGNSERAARWVWDANGHDPIVLNGGLALRHSMIPFLIACRVRGQALVQDSGLRIRSILKFGNENNELRWWRVEPRDSQDDLQVSITELEREMRRLNSGDVGDIPSRSNSGQPSGQATERSQGHTFLTTTIGGNANVVMGDVVHESGSGHRLFEAQRQQLGFPSTISNLPQRLEG